MFGRVLYKLLFSCFNETQLLGNFIKDKYFGEKKHSVTFNDNDRPHGKFKSLTPNVHQKVIKFKNVKNTRGRVLLLVKFT